MSPRRRRDPEQPDFFALPPQQRQPLRWGLPVTVIVATVVTALAIAGSVFVVVNHVRDDDEQDRVTSALGYVRGFMAAYTSVDPFHANEYTDRINEQATGDFAKDFGTKRNEILIRVAQAEPTTGSVLAAGVQRWNDNGSAEVLVALTVTSKTPDGKSIKEIPSRWLVTTTQEGQQWKISKLIQVI